MASGRLSPRQKMINMMYLVLTALLALNVSAEILQAFEGLHATIEKSALSSSGRNEKLVADIASAVDKEMSTGNNANMDLKPLAINAGAKTREMVAHIISLEKELEKIGQLDPLTGELLHKDETNENYRFWLGDNDQADGGRGNGKAAELRKKLDEYIAWANETMYKLDPAKGKTFFSKLAIEPADDPTVTNQESKAHTWEYFTFHGKPVIADLTMTSKFKLDIMEVESQILQTAKLALTDKMMFSVDTVFAMEAPLSQVVASGMEYKTRIFLTMGSKSARPEFAGPGLSVDPSGSTATLTMNANGSLIPDGKSEAIQRYSARIKVPQRDGTFKELPLEGQFTVRRPEVVVRSKVVQNLYAGCANTVTVDVPALGEFYRPDFSRSRGGQAITSGANVREVTLVPTARNFTLSVYSNTNGQSIKIEDINYTVLEPPKPAFNIYQGNSVYDGRSKIRKNTTIKLKIDADREFASMLAKDARYTASELNVYVQDGFTTTKVETIRGNFQAGVEYTLSNPKIRSLPPGAKVYFELSEVSRVNFQNNSAVDKRMGIYDRNRFIVLQ